MKIPTLKECEKAIGEPASTWVGRCYEIACKIVDAGLVSRKHGLDGVAVYGHWLGPISPRSHFADRVRVGFVQHGWIYVEGHGIVIDPTRWVFEAKRPYLYVEHEPADGYVRCKYCHMLECEHDSLGANDECALYEPDLWPYDEGGNQWRAAFKKPPPKPTKRAERVPFNVKGDVAVYVGALLDEKDVTQLTAEQIFYLANLAYSELAGRLGGHAVREIYEAICQAGEYFIEFIPLDNRTKAKRETGFAYA